MLMELGGTGVLKALIAYLISAACGPSVTLTASSTFLDFIHSLQPRRRDYTEANRKVAIVITVGYTSAATLATLICNL